MRRMGLAAGFSLVLAAVPARADVSDFLGIWSDAAADGSGISRIVITPGSGDRLNIHVYGKCQPRECDWGGGPARLYAEGPQGHDVTLIAVDIDTGFARKRLTLRPSVGHALRFEMQTDFSDASGRMSYATSSAVAYAGDWNETTRVAETAPAPQPTAPPLASAPVPAEAAPVPSETAPVPDSSSSSWFDNIGIGPSKPRGYAPAAGEDCTPFDPAQARVGYADGSWRVGDFGHRLLNFGPSREKAQRALAVIVFYHFDEQCFVTRDKATMVYWKRNGNVPKDGARGEVCVAIDSAAIRAEEHDGAWSVVSGFSALLDYGDDRAAAEQAASVIKTYRLNRQCFAGPPGSGMQYWLAQ